MAILSASSTAQLVVKTLSGSSLARSLYSDQRRRGYSSATKSASRFHHRVQAVKGLEQRGLAGLILANEACDRADLEWHRVLDAFEVLDAHFSQFHLSP